ncbi:MarR family winged helix-turn-helix transcriptional regulator [Actinomadura alba]|uniref:Winged helix-turn-helix transcriptional regulator n=1 Tax=Actinomadura alba TaxID=406431 RepID=A0ABR7M1V4_9ACTN|nr:MarR family winged helix-turn-helix transcriptional regulator [Actinomadura alba]MBC6471094.1 winged helix-turn-helix transcriptional regulator [Actinomadura alba]
MTKLIKTMRRLMIANVRALCDPTKGGPLTGHEERVSAFEHAGQALAHLSRHGRLTPQNGTVTGGGPALFRLVRFWSRRWATGAVGEAPGRERKVQDVMVLEAVDTAARSKAGVSVADVAHQLGIDRSGASRFVADAIERGHLRRAASDEDARRAALTVTAAGSDLLAGAHAWQEAAYAARCRNSTIEVKSGWSRHWPSAGP